jgi:nicotinamidase-related amidase
MKCVLKFHDDNLLMNKKRHTPQPSVDEHAPVVLLLVDVINDFAFPEATKLLRQAIPAAKQIAALKKRLQGHKVPSIYVNDNFGRWRSDFKTQVERCTVGCAVGAPVAQALRPGENDYFVLKPRHSGFYASALEVLLQSLGAKKLIITGFAADICVLFTANDAYMRDYEIIIPADCIASETISAKQTACRQMKRFLRADMRLSNRLRFESGSVKKQRIRTASS